MAPKIQERFSHWKSLLRIVLIAATMMISGCTTTEILKTTPTAAVTSQYPLRTLTPSAELMRPTLPMITAVQTDPAIKPTQPIIWESSDSGEDANQVRTISLDGTAGMWSGGPGGLVHWDLTNHSSKTYLLSSEPNQGKIVQIVQTLDKTLWVATFGNGIFRFDGKYWRKYTTEDGLPWNYISSMALTKGRLLWVDTFSFQNPLKGGNFGQFDGARWAPAVGGGFLKIVSAPDGSVWSATRDFGVSKFENNQWTPRHLTNEKNTAITIGPDGTVWVAAESAVYKFRNNTWQKIIPPWIGQTHTTVTTIAAGSNGIVWFGFSFNPPDIRDCGERSNYVDEFGAYQYDGNNWKHITTKNGLIDNKICDIEIGSDGNVWFGTFDKGVSRFDGRSWISCDVP